MNPADPIILAAYLLCVLIFLNRIVAAFNDEFAIRLDKEALEAQLTQQNLQDAIAISFKFDKQYEFTKLKQLAISIENKSSDYSLYVDWDYSVFTDLDGRSRRVTRLAPGSTLDLFQPQVFSTIAPHTTLKETITAEDVLARKAERKDDKLAKEAPTNLEIEVTKPIIDLSKPNLKKAPEAKKKRYRKFMERQLELDFSLDLALRLVGPGRTLGGDRVALRCRFILTKLPWTAGLPWNPKK